MTPGSHSAVYRSRRSFFVMVLIHGEPPTLGDFTSPAQVRRCHVAESGLLSYGLVVCLRLLSTGALRLPQLPSAIRQPAFLPGEDLHLSSGASSQTHAGGFQPAHGEGRGLGMNSIPADSSLLGQSRSCESRTLPWGGLKPARPSNGSPSGDVLHSEPRSPSHRTQNTSKFSD